MNEKNGLTTIDIESQRQKFGFNVLPKQKESHWWNIIFEQLKSPLNILLILAALISYFLGEKLDSIFIVIVLITNALVGLYQELKAKKELESLAKMVVLFVRVIRNGIESKIETKELVPDDLIILNEGDKIPADCKILSCKNLTVDESSLTGESVAVEKNVHDEIYMSSTVLTGHAKARVFAIGVQTKFGQIALSLSEIPEEKTPLEIKLASLGNKITIGVLGIIIIVGIIGFFQGRDLKTLFFSAIALAVSAIPEGLPAVLTIALSVGVGRLAKRGGIVKRLLATETLGSVEIILTDKTGTLTKNQMTVREIITNSGKTFTVSGAGYNNNGSILENDKEISLDKLDSDLAKIIQSSILCNSSSLAIVEDGKESYSVLGDTTEGALLVLARKAKFNEVEIKEQNIIKEEIPFDSDRKMMTVLVGSEIFSKGAPEKILGICSNLSVAQKSKFLKDIETLGSKGYRLLAFASKKVDEKNIDKNSLEKDLNFHGIVAISDPPREEVKDAISLCRKSGIEVVMITGDSNHTAQTIGEQIGIMTEGKEVITGDQLKQMSEESLLQNLGKIAIFSRVSPADKLRIVLAYQKLGKIVAVTGDGVNDSPALKKAEIGVSMGITGTEVAKEASDLVISDDNFTTIVSAIEEGRVIFLNLVKTIKYLLASNLSEVFTVCFSMLIGLPLPMSASAILWMNVVTDGLPALSLAIDPKDGKSLHFNKQTLGIGPELIDSKLYRQIISIGLFLGMISVGIYYLLIPYGLELARFTTFTLLVVEQLILAFVVRGRSQKILGNPSLLFATGIALALQIIILTVPGLRERFV